MKTCPTRRPAVPRAAQPRPLACVLSSEPSQENSAQASPLRDPQRTSRSASTAAKTSSALSLPTKVLADEGDVRRLQQINIFPLIHSGDPPSASKAVGEGWC